MILGFKTELKLNASQRVLLAKHAGTARHAWTWGLGLTKQILDNRISLWAGERRHFQNEAGRRC